MICAFVLMVAFSMAELTSRYPTAGGPYWWAHDLGGKGWSWMTGWFNIVGLVGIVASVAYGCAFFLFNLLQLYSVDIFGVNFGDDVHILGESWLLFFIILFLYTLVNIFADRILALMNNISVGWHLLGVAVDHRGCSSSCRTTTRAPASSSASGSTTAAPSAATPAASASGSWCCRSGFLLDDVHADRL